MEETTVRKIIGTIGTTVAVVVAMATTAGLAEASHREGTKILKDPTADNVDTYAFTASATAQPPFETESDFNHDLALSASWIPHADPAGGPSFFPLDEDARYYAESGELSSGFVIGIPKITINTSA